MTRVTLSHRRQRRFWGWGYDDSSLDERELATVRLMVEQLGGSFELRAVPRVEEFAARIAH